MAVWTSCETTIDAPEDVRVAPATGTTAYDLIILLGPAGAVGLKGRLLLTRAVAVELWNQLGTVLDGA